MTEKIIAVCAPNRSGIGTACDCWGMGHAAYIVRPDQPHLVTCPWCLGARTVPEAKKIVEKLYSEPPREPAGRGGGVVGGR